MTTDRVEALVLLLLLIIGFCAWVADRIARWADRMSREEREEALEEREKFIG